MSKSEYLALSRLAPRLGLELNGYVLAPLGVNLHTARRLSCRKEVARNGGEMAPLVGDFYVLHGGDNIARVRVHHLYGDVDKRFLAVGSTKSAPTCRFTFASYPSATVGTEV